MTAAEKVHYWILKYNIANGVLPKSKEIMNQLEVAIEDEKQVLSIANVELLKVLGNHIAEQYDLEASGVIEQLNWKHKNL